MHKSILITGSTDGIGLATARALLSRGHRVLLHGRNAEKLEQAHSELAEQTGNALIETYLADLSHMANLAKGADILCKAALTEAFLAASGQYFDNDSGQFTKPHPDALNTKK